MPSPQKTQTRAEIVRFDQSGELLRRVLDSAAVGMVLVGIEREILFANAAFAEMLGYSVGEALGMKLSTFLHPDDASGAVQSMSRMFAGEAEIHRAEGKLRHKDGHFVWVDAGASLVRNDQTGQPMYVALQLTSINGAKRAEAALAYSEGRWNYALESGRQGVWDSDVRTGVLFYSRMWRQIRGIPHDEQVDSSMALWLARIHPDDRERVLGIIMSRQRGELPTNSFEYREQHRAGHYIWLLSRGRVVEWQSNGKPARVIGTDTDITHLKLVEQELAAEKERLRVTLQAIADAVICTDARGMVSMMNPIAGEMTGWAESEGEGRAIEEIFHVVHSSTGEAAPNPVSDCLRSGKLTYLDRDIVLVGRGGLRRNVRSSAAPVRGHEGAITGAVLIFHDITDVEAQQKELAHSASHDALTGLPNRPAFDRALENAAESARRDNRKHALLYIDLDRFKPINDTAGHSAGDELLRIVAQVIRGCCRAKDLPARLGGDEFVLLLPDCSAADAQVVARKVISAIDALDFSWKGGRYRIGASVGITAITRRGPSRPGFTGEADAACYAAKAQGRGRAVAFSELDAALKEA